MELEVIKSAQGYDNYKIIGEMSEELKKFFTQKGYRWSNYNKCYYPATLESKYENKNFTEELKKTFFSNDNVVVGVGVAPTISALRFPEELPATRLRPSPTTINQNINQNEQNVKENENINNEKIVYLEELIAELREELRKQKEKINELESRQIEKLQVINQQQNITTETESALVEEQENEEEVIFTEEDLEIFAKVIPPNQYATTLQLTQEEEGEFYKKKLKDISNIVKKITTETELINEDKTHTLGLHYFVDDSDFYISEISPDGLAFGYTILNGDLEMAEWGYQDIKEIINCSQWIELDYHVPEGMTIERMLEERYPKYYKKEEDIEVEELNNLQEYENSNTFYDNIISEITEAGYSLDVSRQNNLLNVNLFDKEGNNIFEGKETDNIIMPVSHEIYATRDEDEMHIQYLANQFFTKAYEEHLTDEKYINKVFEKQEKIELKTYHQLKREEIEGLKEISQEDFENVIDMLYKLPNPDYKSLPSIIKLPQINRKLANKLGVENANFFMKSEIAHVRPERKSSYNQNLRIEEMKGLLNFVKECEIAYIDTDEKHQNFILAGLDEKDETKINKIVFNKDELGNYVVTIGKIKKEDLNEKQYNKVAVGVEPTIWREFNSLPIATTLRSSTTLQIKDNLDDLKIEQEDKNVNENNLHDILIKALEEDSVKLPIVDYSYQNYDVLFPQGYIETPIETLKMGNNQFEKFNSPDRDYLLAAAYQTLTTPSLIFDSESVDSKSGKLKPVRIYGKSFYKENKDKSRVVESVIIFREEDNIVISTHNKDFSRFVNQIKKAEQIIYADKIVSQLCELEKNGLAYVRTEGENAQFLNPRYNENSLLSIEDLIASNKLSVKNSIENSINNITQLPEVHTKKDIKQIREQAYKILQKPDEEITHEDKIILSQYEGGGGLNEKNRSTSAVLNEFYTPNNLVEVMWNIVDSYAPNAVTVLEPSAGIGKFANNRINNEFTMHELDETSARINKLLHPEANIIQGAYQKQFLDKNGRVRNPDFVQPTYDVVIGNPPYGDYTGEYKAIEGKEHNRYEEYFIEKGLDALKDEKSILAFVVPSGFLNSKKDKIKEIIASKGILLDAYRLPEGTFPTTQVGTDIIIMQKNLSWEEANQSIFRNYEEFEEQNKIEIERELDRISNGNYFKLHPQHILGEVKTRINRFGKEEEYVSVHEGLTIQDELDKIYEIDKGVKKVSLLDKYNKKYWGPVVPGDTRFDVSLVTEERLEEFKNLSIQLSEYFDNGIRPENDRFIIGKTPRVLQETGSEYTEVTVPVSVIKKAVETHNLTENEILNALARIKMPIFVFDSDKETTENKVESKLVITDVFKDEKPIALAINTNSTIDINNRGLTVEVQDIRSIHDRTLIAKNGTDLIQKWTIDGLCKYVDDRKISDWSTVARVYFPIELLQSDNLNILTRTKLVNSISQEEHIESNSTQSTNEILLEKLKSAGIEVIIDKDEFNRILEQETLLQKMQDINPNEYFKFDKEDTKNFITQIKQWEENSINIAKMVVVGKIPPIMKVLGISDNLIEVQYSTLSKMIKEEPLYSNDKQGHNLSIDDIYAIPNELANPVMVFKSKTRNDSYVFFTERKDNQNRTILIPLAVDKKKGRIVINEITSMYGRNNEIEFVKDNIDKNKLLYIDIERSKEWYTNEKSFNGKRSSQIQFLTQRSTDIETYSPSILTKERLVNFISANNSLNEKSPIQKMALRSVLDKDGNIEWNGIDYTMKSWIEFNRYRKTIYLEKDEQGWGQYYLAINSSIRDLQNEYGENYYPEKAIEDGKLLVFESDTELNNFVLETYDIKNKYQEIDTVYGFTHNNKIYLNPDVMNSNVIAHEYTHLWDNYVQKTNPELWEKGKGFFKDSSLWNEIKADKNYKDIADDEDLLLSECHARIVGKMAKEVLAHIAERDGEVTKDAIINWDKEVEEYLQSTLFAMNENEEAVEFRKEFFAQPMKDLFSGKQILQKVENIVKHKNSRKNTVKQKENLEESPKVLKEVVDRKIMDTEDFSKLYGKKFDEKEISIWKATNWEGIIDLSKLTFEEVKSLESNENYIQIDFSKWTHRILFMSGDIYEKIKNYEDKIAYNQEKLINNDYDDKPNSQLKQEIALYSKNINLLNSVKKDLVPIEDIHLSLKAAITEDFFINHFDEEGNLVKLNLQESFILWAKNESYADMKNRNFIDFSTSNISREELNEKVSWSDIISYIDNEPVKAERTTSSYRDEEAVKELKAQRKKEADEKRQARSDIANKLFDRYIHEGLSEEVKHNLEYEYNQKFNSYIAPDYSKLPLVIDGMSSHKGSTSFKLYEQQIKGISFLCNKGNGLLAYDVGVGKTAAGIVATVNQMQLGRSKRPLIIVPNQVYSKWYTDIKELFPNIKINDLFNLNSKSVQNYRDKENYNKLNIPENSITLVTYEALSHITFTDDSIENDLFEDFKNLLSIDFDGNDKENSIAIEKIKEVIGYSSNVKDSNYFFFEDCGFDNITVDEAHKFKNLWTVPRPNNKGESNEFSGIPQTKPSTRALKLYATTQLIQRNNDNRNVFLLTATPFTNSPLEVYSMLTYIGRERLHRAGINSLRDFLNQFAQTKYELGVNSKGEIDTKQVMKNWKQLPVLQSILTEYIDKVDGEEAGIIRPKKFTHVKPLDMTPLQKKMRECDEQRMSSRENSADIIVAMNNMRMAAVAPALANQYMYPDIKLPSMNELVETSPKLSFVCNSIIDMYKTNSEKGQFLYLPLGKDAHGIIKEYLIKHGIPKEAIEIINGEVNNTPEKKEKITSKFNNPNEKLKIIIGGINTSEGIDLNGNSFVMYNCSLGWNPSETIQAEGRIWRQGNQQGHVHIVYPLMNDSIDSVLYQKHDEKRSRINELWTYKGDYLNVEDINPEELKLELIKDPKKRAKLILEEETKDLMAELSRIDLKIKNYDEIIENKICLNMEKEKLEESIKDYSKTIQDYKNRNEEVPLWYKSCLDRDKRNLKSTNLKLDKIYLKLEKLNIVDENSSTAYIRKLNEQKKVLDEKINNVKAKIPEIIEKLQKELAEQKLLEYPVDKQRKILEADILSNLRPMAEVEKEIKTARHEKMMNFKFHNKEISEEEYKIYVRAGYELYEKYIKGEVDFSYLQNKVQGELPVIKDLSNNNTVVYKWNQDELFFENEGIVNDSSTITYSKNENQIDDVSITPEQITESEIKRDEIILPILNGKKSGMYKAFNDFAEHGVFDIIGSQIELENNIISKTGWNQLHAAMNIYRDKKFETFRYIFIEKESGKIKDQVALASYMPNRCSISQNENTLKEVISRAEEKDYLIAVCHNHPSGNIEPSIQDVETTEELKNILTPIEGKSRFIGHIILDHNSFSYYEPKTGWNESNYDGKEKDILLNEKYIFNDSYINNPSHLSVIASKINDVNNWNDDFIPVVFTNGANMITGLKLYHKDYFNQQSEIIRNDFQFDGLNVGSIRAFPIITENFAKNNDIKEFEKLLLTHVKNNAFQDASLPFELSITEKFNITPGKNYFDKSSYEETKVNSTWIRYVNPKLFNDNHKNVKQTSCVEW